jgi:hypothetical protein
MDENMRKQILMQKRQHMQSIGSDIGGASFCTYN